MEGSSVLSRPIGDVLRFSEGSKDRKQKVMEQSAEKSRKIRADALRNRERVLAAATAVFSAGGADASLEAVARRAGLGIGTLYRHFPTREALYEAVYQHEVQQLWELAERLKDEASPVEALRRGMYAIVEFIATKKGMSAALALAVTGFSELHARSSPRLEKAARTLLERAVAAGEVRSGINPGDLMRAVIGMCLVHDQPGWQANVLRMVVVLIDGLRVGAKQRKAAVNRRSSTRSRLLANKPAMR
jgi:AcrR family transcriptional regulator